MDEKEIIEVLKRERDRYEDGIADDIIHMTQEMTYRGRISLPKYLEVCKAIVNKDKEIDNIYKNIKFLENLIERLEE